MTPIWSPDAEESVLGAMLLTPKAIDDCAEILVPEAFFRESHGLIFQAIIDTADHGRPADALTVVGWLDAGGLLKKAGGAERIHELAAIVPAASNAAHYAKIVRAKWVLRELEGAGHRLIELSHDGQGSLSDIVSEADRVVLGVSQKASSKKGSLVSSKDLVADFRIRMAQEEGEGGVATPFPDFLRPLRGSRLYVLGGYSGDGKSSLVPQFVRSACEDGARVYVGSAEMNKADLTDRMVATFGVPLSSILDHDISLYQDVVEDALGQIEAWDFDVEHSSNLTAADMRRAQRSGKYDFLIFDHLHHIRIKDKRHAYEELSDTVKRFTDIANEFDVPVLLLSQLSRGDKYNPFPRPTMRDVKGTGAIEQLASMVSFIYRKRDEQHERTNEAELIIAKNRFGPEGSLDLRFRPGYVRFDLQHQTGG